MMAQCSVTQQFEQRPVHSVKRLFKLTKHDIQRTTLRNDSVNRFCRLCPQACAPFDLVHTPSMQALVVKLALAGELRCRDTSTARSLYFHES